MKMSFVLGVGVSAVLFLSASTSASAAETSPAPSESWPLIGTWHGAGTLMGSRADLYARWSETLDGRFVRLEYRTRRYTDEGEKHFDATAFYRFSGASANGHWFDSWGNITELQVGIDGNRVIVDWQSGDGRGGTGAGTTEYILDGPDRLEVRDVAHTPDGPREFGSAIYHRVESDAPPPGDGTR